jgi:hypothetical protein
MRSSEAEEVVKFRSRPGAGQKPEKNAEHELGESNGECSLLAANDALLGEERVLSCDHHAASFVACFVTMECATSLDRDPTILISCQS